MTEAFKAAVIIGLTVMATRQGWVSTGTPAAEETPAAAHPAGAAEMVPLEPFVVNVNTGTAAAAYLRVAIGLSVKDTRTAQALRSDPELAARLRAALLAELGGQTVPLIVTAEGRTALAKQLEARASTVVPDVPIELLITDFVVEY